MNTKLKSRPRNRARPRSRRLPPVENYTDQRIAEFILNNSVDAEDYQQACEDVRQLGLDPKKIRHTKPVGAR